MYFTAIDVVKRDGCPACQGSTTVSSRKEKLVWLCGRDTVNINPDRASRIDINQAYGSISRHFKVRVKSQLAVMFDYKGFEISLFNGGRMLIRNVNDEKTALEVYRKVIEKLGAV
jgi:hypothetical protein